MLRSTPLIVICVVLGCGTSLYESRVAETAKYYEYQNELDRVLEKQSTGLKGLELRLPRGLEEIEAPKKKQDEESEAATEPAGDGNSEDDSIENRVATVDPNDPRLPPYLSVGLPGLVAAYRGVVPLDPMIDADGNKIETASGEQDPNFGRDRGAEGAADDPNKGLCWVHIFSNYPLALADQILPGVDGIPRTLREYNDYVGERIAESLRVPPPSADVKELVRMPKQQPSYTQQVDLYYIPLNLNQPRAFGGEQAVLDIYQTSSNGVQVTILIAYPARVAPGNSRLINGLDRMLETIRLEGDLPRPSEAARINAAEGDDEPSRRRPGIGSGF